MRVEVYNSLGQLVTMLVNERLTAGVYRATWDARDFSGSRVASGVYLYRLVAEDRILTRKMVLLKWNSSVWQLCCDILSNNLPDSDLSRHLPTVFSLKSFIGA